jgi:NodT family efflux transporter outer membrane factor (OMF) lipoprotein
VRLLPPSFITFARTLILACLGACAVGPDFQPPPPADTTTYDSEVTPDTTEATDDHAGGAAQKLLAGQDIPALWWTLFQSEPLNQLIDRAMRKNPDLAAAQASLRLAQENVAAGESVLFPEIDGSFSSTRQKTAGASFGGSFPSEVFTLHNATVSVTYALDVWGGARRGIEELTAQQDFQRFQLEATYLTLTSNVVTAAIQEASLRGQIVATQAIIEQEAHQRSLLKSQLDLGAVAKIALLQQEATLAQTRATLPPLEKQLAQTRHLLSILAGDFPSNAPTAVFDLPSLHLPEAIPLSLPSQLVEQRPDIRAAEASLHAASAAIGVAEANRLPQLTLSADIGDAANTLGKLFSPGTGLWSLGLSALQPLFDAGKLAHQQGAAEAEYDRTVAQYRKTVLASFQDVADVLRALQSDAQALKAEDAAERAAAESLQLAHIQFKDGSTDYLVLLTAEQADQQAKITLVRAQAQRYADTAALFQALGGGWWNRPVDVTKTTLTNAEALANDARQGVATIDKAGEPIAAKRNFNRIPQGDDPIPQGDDPKGNPSTQGAKP